MEIQQWTVRLWDREITAVLHLLGRDCAVVISGGGKEHIGAVSLCAEDGAVQTIVLPGHKEQFITEPWCRQIHALRGGSVSVTAGIHYDHLSAEQIDEVMRAVQDLLEEVLSTFPASRVE